MEDVIVAIRRITPLGEIEAIQRMLEAHQTGHAVLLITNRERGELYVDQFTSCKITTSLELDE